MLEQKIEDLTQAVFLLIAAINASSATAPLPVPKAPALSTQVTPAEQPPAVAKVSREDVQELCMVLVRADRSLKNTVRDTIAEFNGAATLKDVTENDLAALKAKLEALR